MVDLQPPKQYRTPEELAAWEWENDTLPRLRDSGLEPRFHARITEWGNVKQKAVYDRVSALLCRKGAIFALVGPRGTGKTTICSQLIVDRAVNTALPPWERQPPYRKMVALVARFKAFYADFGTIDMESLRSSRESFANCPFAVIDEIHECDDMKMKSRVLTDLLDLRYSRRNDTVLISNQTPEEFRTTTSDSILSRLAEHGSIIDCTWQSWRAPKK